MKYKIRVCDVCKKRITDADIKYKFKMYENSYCNYDDFEFNKRSKLDMCEDCYNSFIEFVHLKQKESLQ